jgi:hypothetical protein
MWSMEPLRRVTFWQSNPKAAQRLHGAIRRRRLHSKHKKGERRSLCHVESNETAHFASVTTAQHGRQRTCRCSYPWRWTGRVCCDLYLKDLMVTCLHLMSGRLMAAAWMAQTGVQTLLVEQRPYGTQNGRADGLESRTLEILDSFGLADKIWAEANHTVEIALWVSKHAHSSPLNATNRTCIYRASQTPAFFNERESLPTRSPDGPGFMSQPSARAGLKNTC